MEINYSNSTNRHRKVRWKRNSNFSLRRHRLLGLDFKFLLLTICIYFNLLSVVTANRPPRFLIDGQSEIVLRLKEGSETPVGSLIYKLKGFDPDGDPLTFGVINTFNSDILKVENAGNNEAEIFLNKELDRETKDEYSIILTLTDNKLGEGNFVTQSLLLLVEDVNDNEPVFKSYKSALEVPENSPPGILTTVEATDRDEGSFGQVVYYLEELDGDNDIFSIATNQGKGIIRLTGSLDYERKSLYQLRVLAVDRANQGQINTGTAAIVVKVRDVEDQPPEFVVASPVTRVPEDLPRGSKVLEVRAIDGDRGINNKIKYSILTGGNNLFKIDEDTGVITTLKPLDREDSRNLINGAYILEILATERSTLKPPPAVKTEVTIILTDVNDQTPTFRSQRYECEIPENSQQNTPVIFLGDARNDVFDHDLGNNGTFELYLDPPNDIFDISPRRSVNEATFIIKVRNSKLLDYEKHKILNLTIVAKEITADGKFSTAPLIIHIRDRNDHAPEFTKPSYEISIPENVAVGTTIAKVQAVDLDSGDYGTKGIRYTGITGSIAQLLNLDAITGSITVKSSGGNYFDRELFARHYLTVEARDEMGHGNRNTVPLLINIEDVNDNAPIFVQGKYETRLLENKHTFETPLQVEAQDADLNGTRNSEIFYEIIDGEFKNNFTIDSTTGLIQLISPIDFEALGPGNSNIRPLFLTVQAVDGGIPPMFAKVSVIIYVQDENDHAPVFQSSDYEISIPEDLPGGTSVLSIKAFDKDGSSPNNNVVYRIINGASDKFVVGSENGVISVAHGASLDPDLTDPETTNYLLTVSALDGGIGSQQLSNTCTVNITIIDVNNKPPVFSEFEIVYITENTPVGTYSYRLIAHDMDSEPMLRYYFDNDTSEARTENGVIIKQSEYDYLSAFELNPIDGLIRIVKLLDRERIETIKIGVVVEDIAAASGKQFAFGTLNVVIEDENDNNPKFQKPYYKKSIMENSQLGVTIVNLVATDLDKNRSITYDIEGPEDIVSLVYLDPETGEILVREKIDHEVFQWLNFTVRATDSGYPPRSSLVDVFIQVLDENDNNPYFVSEFESLSVLENSPVGSRIAQIKADDADSGDFGKITFLIDRVSSLGKFTIDADTGVLSVADNIDRETRSSYMVVIEIWDNYQFGYASGESRNAFKQLHINVLDENDSPPEIAVPEHCVQITEFHDVKEHVVAIKGKDNDDPTSPNGQIKFEISGGSGADYFYIRQIDHWNVNIYARQPLNGLYGNYSIMIIGKDLGIPQNIVKKQVDICIQDYNDHPPVFVSPANNFTIRVPENITVGTNIVQVLAKDEDVGLNAAVKYRLKPDLMGNFKTFDIDDTSGWISLKNSLDREKQKIYEIRVEAYDQGIPTTLSSDLDLIIYVRRNQDYEPQFLVESIGVNFTEHTKPGMEKRKLPDTVDRDEVDDLDDPPSTVCYFIVYGNEEGYFHIDPQTHVLTVMKELDREKQSNHTLIIKATEDCLTPPTSLIYNISQQAMRHSIDRQDPDVSRIRMINGKLKMLDNYERYRESQNLMYDLIGEEGEMEFMPSAEALVSNNIVADDSTLVKVIVQVQDINDNPPQFITKIFTGGVTTSADFGTKFMHVKAIDKDVGNNAKISYYQIGDIHRTLTEGLEHIQKAPFLVERNTGAIQLNFDPQKGMKGYFDFTVLANDTGGFKDVAHVFIYLLREDQRVKFVLRQQPSEVREHIDKFRATFSNVTNAIVNIDDFKVHENKDGSVDKTRTDLYLHLVDKKDNSIIEVSDVLRMVDHNIEKLDDLFKEFNVLDTQASESLLLTAQFGNPQMIIWLVVINLFMGAMMIIILTLCISQRTNYRRQLKAARISAYAPTEISERVGVTNRVPNTNKHSMEGSNPMWMKAYENEWFKNDDSFSQGSRGNDSLDENVLVNEDDQNNGTLYKSNDCYISATLSKEFNGLNTQNNMIKHYNVYQQIDKLTNGTILAKKLETTEL